MKRFVVSVIAVVSATIAGVAFSLSPAVATAVGSNGTRYVALGDSVAAGAGLPLAPGTPEEQACGRSEQAYPYQLAAAQGLYVEHIACSGAKADEGLYGAQERDGTDIPPQLDRAFAMGAPELMTITIGANDARWAQFAAKCYQFSCGTGWDDLALAAYFTDLRWELHQTLVKIRDLSGTSTPPQVIFTGYFSPFDPSGPSCADTRNFTAAEMTWMNAQVDTLNRIIINAVAPYDFAAYAPVDFSGHELCSDDPWIQGVQGGAPLHPTQEGQAAIARSVSAVIDGGQEDQGQVQAARLLSAGTTGREPTEEEAVQQRPPNSVDQEDTQASETDAQDSPAGVVVEQPDQSGQDNACNADHQVSVL